VRSLLASSSEPIEAMTATTDLNEALRTFEKFIKRMGYGGSPLLASVLASSSEPIEAMSERIEALAFELE
jgi:hypothetical protein